MHEIICPHCGKAFKIDEAGYANILKQVRDSEFEQQLHARCFGAEAGFQQAVLAHLSAILGLGGKAGHYSIADARACLAGDERARRKMRRYNLGDVAQDTLGGVFERLRPWIRGLNLGALALTDEKRCPYCASENVRRNGWYTAAVQSYAQWTCDDCGGHSRSNIVKSRASLRGVS